MLVDPITRMPYFLVKYIKGFISQSLNTIHFVDLLISQYLMKNEAK